jgi:hypothetical protein
MSSETITHQDGGGLLPWLYRRAKNLEGDGRKFNSGVQWEYILAIIDL